MDIQIELQKIHAQYGITEKANYEIQKLFDKALLKQECKIVTVPYQCCPVCNGSGQTVAGGFTSNCYETCRVCNGAMIIPMHALNIYENITKSK